MPVKKFIREREVCRETAIFASIFLRQKEKRRGTHTGVILAVNFLLLFWGRIHLGLVVPVRSVIQNS